MGQSHLALDALQPEHNLLRGLRLLVEDGLGLTTITALLAVVSALTLAIVESVSVTSCGYRGAADGTVDQVERRGSSLIVRAGLVSRDTYANREAWAIC